MLLKVIQDAVLDAVLDAPKSSQDAVLDGAAQPSCKEPQRSIVQDLFHQICHTSNSVKKKSHRTITSKFQLRSSTGQEQCRPRLHDREQKELTNSHKPIGGTPVYHS